MTDRPAGLDNLLGFVAANLPDEDDHPAAPAPLSPEREQEIKQAQPGDWLPGPWTIRDIEGTGDESGRWELVHHQTGNVLATLPDWAGNVALWAADAHDAVPELLAELNRTRAERDAFADRIDTLTAVAKSNKAHVQTMYGDLQEAQRERDQPAAALADVLRLVSAWCVEANETGGVDAGDLAWRLQQAGHPLPDEETAPPRVVSHTYEGDGGPCRAEAYGEVCGAPRADHQLIEETAAEAEGSAR